MIKISDKASCCGCEACVQACVLNCITMKTDAEGFWYPAVDEARCVNCGACDKACPILNPTESPEGVSVYAVRCADMDIRKASSSGGVFSLLAESILEDGGVVFGAAFGEGFSVFHTLARNTQELAALRGSKYLQSSIGDTYQQAKHLLKSGTPVLFTGTPCQIAGLKTYLGKEYENLHTADILCHGVPSPEVWKKYLQDQEVKQDSKIEAVSFRNKADGWHRYSLALLFQNKEVYNSVYFEDQFMKLFLADICLRPSCHDCKFRESRSGADLTIGDAWGIEQWMPEMDDDRGTSVVFVNTDKGFRMLMACKNKAEIREADADKVIACNAVYRKPVKAHPNREQFFRAVAAGWSMEELTVLCRKPLPQRVEEIGKRCVKKILTTFSIKF